MKPSLTKTNVACQTPSDAARTRIVIVDGQGSTRGLFREALARHDDYELVGEGRTGTDALRLCRQLQPDVLIMELMLREIGAASVVAALREQNSPTRTLIFTASRHETALIDAMRMRPHGLVHKDESSPAIWNALHIVVRGGFAVSATLGPLHERALSGEPGLVLTSRERAVLQMIAEGQPNKAMAQALVTSDRAIERARENLMKKLDAHDIATVTRIAVQMGLV